MHASRGTLRANLAVVALGLGSLWPSYGELVITEFMADNSGLSMTDEDGAPSDWIEVYNAGSAAQSALGYTLTDNVNNLSKWAFPDVTIPAGGYLIVFASGKDRAIAGSELHTNFSLDDRGEYLALIKPDGATLTTSFHPNYPQQYQDVSYGVGSGGAIEPQTLISADGALKYFVPTTNIGIGWRAPYFDDADWTDAQGALGYGFLGEVADQISPTGNVEGVMKGVNGSIMVRMRFQIDDLDAVQELFFKAKVDDGFVAFLNGVEVASLNSPASLLFNSTATANGDPTGEFEYFPIDFSGKLVEGENVLAVQGLNRSTGNRDFALICELEGEIQDLSAPLVDGYFAEITPNGPNGPPQYEPPVAVEYSVTSKAFSEDFTLTLSHPDPEVVIRVTTDGSLPVHDSETPSPEYLGPLSITRSTLVRARAFKDRSLDGIGRSEGFIKLASSETSFSSDLPVVMLSTFGKGAPPSTDSTTRKDVFMLLFEPDPVTGRTTLESVPTVATRGGFRKRGSSSGGNAKYSMSLETWDEFGEDQDIKPLDFKSEADWILSARYSFDRSLMRNTFAYALSNEVGLWAPGTRFVELYNDISGTEVTSDDYFGVYAFMDKIEINKNRVDIKKIDPWETTEPKITGGYIFKNDRGDPGEQTFSVTGFGRALVNVDPGVVEMTTQQKTYLRNYCNEATVALRSSTGVHPTTGKHFTEYFDVEAFIEHFWLNVFFMDPDWGRLSQFFYFDRGGKIVSGPLWDYDRTMGSRDGRDDNPRRWEANTSDTSFTWFDREYEWFGLLFGFNTSHDQARNMQDPQLKTSRKDVFQQVIDKWYELRANSLSEQNYNAIIDRMQSELTESQARNFARWTQVAPGGITGMNFSQPGLAGWYREVSHLRGWLGARAEWIDQQFFNPPTFNKDGGTVPQGFALSMTSGNGSVYFTTDGSDPRAQGGLPSGAASSGSSLTINASQVVTARAYDGQQWGAPTQATFVVGGDLAETTNLVISEIMYNPADPSAEELAAGFDNNNLFEYLEIYNVSDQPVDLIGVSFTDGIDFDFNNSSITVIEPKGRVLVVKSRAAFQYRYGSELNSLIAGEFANDTGLSKSGEHLVLSGVGGVIRDLTYNDRYPWPVAPDGSGSSIVLVSPETLPDENLGTNWRASVGELGSAGIGDGLAFSGDMNVDADGDGLSAFAEYAFGTSDEVPNQLDEILTTGIADGGFFTVSHPISLAADDALSILEVSDDLATWNPADQRLKLVEEVHQGDGRAIRTFHAVEAAGDRSRLFTRIRVIER